jgi:hypothetical protein
LADEFIEAQGAHSADLNQDADQEGLTIQPEIDESDRLASDDDEDDDDDDDEDNVNIVISDIVNKPYSATTGMLQQQQSQTSTNNNQSALLTWQKGGVKQPGQPAGPGVPGAIGTGPQAGKPPGLSAPGGPQAKAGVDLEAPGTINDLPTYEYNLQEVSDEDKPWRKPGADITDYFNYGFNEETWIAYCMKQKRLRAENAMGIKMPMQGGPFQSGGGMIQQPYQPPPLPPGSSLPASLVTSNIQILNTQAGGSSGAGLNASMVPPGMPPGIQSLNQSNMQMHGGGPNMPYQQQHMNQMQQGNMMSNQQMGGYQGRMPYQPRYPPPSMQQQGPYQQQQQMRPQLNDPNNMRQQQQQRGVYGSDSNESVL